MHTHTHTDQLTVTSLDITGKQLDKQLETKGKINDNQTCFLSKLNRLKFTNKLLNAKRIRFVTPYKNFYPPTIKNIYEWEHLQG